MGLAPPTAVPLVPLRWHSPRGWTTAPARSRRVSILLWAVVILSAGDLAMTLEYATSVGLIESNPIARFMMTFGTAWTIVFFKCLSLLLGIAILFKLRITRSGEVGAWICFVALTWLTFRWVGYNSHMSAIARPGDTTVVLSQHDFTTIEN